MSYQPASLKALGAYWVKEGGVNLGVVGNTAHTIGYHLGKDRIYDGSGPGKGDLDYSVRTSRDKAGLTNAASAIDLGRLDGSLTELWKFSRWFAQQCFDGKPGYRDVREVIFWSTARERVIGWSALAPTQWINDYGDLSHKTHTHISFYRDSESRDKVALFKPYFPAVVVPEDEMILTRSLPGYTASVRATSNIRSAPSLSAGIIRVASAVETWTVIGTIKGQVDPDDGSDQWYVRWNAGRWEYTANSNVPAAPVAPVSLTAFLDAEAAAIAARAALTLCNLKVTRAKEILG